MFYMTKKDATLEEFIFSAGSSAAIYALVGFFMFILISFWLIKIFKLNWIIGYSLAFLFLVVYVILMYKLMEKKKKQ